NRLKQLAGQTAIYGLSSIIGRFLNYLLVPVHTQKNAFDPEQYGVVSEMYSYVAFLIILLLYGMETAFFRFNTTDKHDPRKTYTTAVYSLLFTTALFIAGAILFRLPIAELLRYPNHSEYVAWFAIIIGLDAIGAIPLAKLRAENRAKRFAAVNLVNVGVNISLNLFWVGYCIPAAKAGHSNFLLEHFYDPEIGVGYVFRANLAASGVKFLMLVPELLKARYGMDWRLFREMLVYAAPLLIAGLAGIINETLDRILIKWLLLPEGEEYAMYQLGVYGACYKLSIIMTLFLQAFRYAAEPFFFAQAKASDSRETYATVMTYFVLVLSVIFVGVTLFLDIFKYFIPNQEYWEGLQVVPVLLLANLFLGIFYNQSVWYKLTNRTVYGAYIALVGAAITVVLNLWWIPVLGYMGSAWATLICYASMALISYLLGQRFYAVPYRLKKIFFFLALAVGTYSISEAIRHNAGLTIDWRNIAQNLGLFALFIGILLAVEKPWRLWRSSPSTNE
ncbi:MAG: oligosaccharide flippase family protein, partial [Bacteroidota bacterium]